MQGSLLYVEVQQAGSLLTDGKHEKFEGPAVWLISVLFPRSRTVTTVGHTVAPLKGQCH
jgi:hypothetical protein